MSGISPQNANPELGSPLTEHVTSKTKRIVEDVLAPASEQGKQVMCKEFGKILMKRPCILHSRNRNTVERCHGAKKDQDR